MTQKLIGYRLKKDLPGYFAGCLLGADTKTIEVVITKDNLDWLEPVYEEEKSDEEVLAEFICEDLIGMKNCFYGPSMSIAIKGTPIEPGTFLGLASRLISIFGLDVSKLKLIKKS